MILPAELISKSYRASQVALHARPGGYGGKGDKWAQAVADLVRAHDATSVLDYGAGQRSLSRALKALLPPSVRVTDYDPAVPAIDGMPSFADLVVCTDVLEHVEPDRLDRVLAHLQMLARKAVFVVIATRASNKTLPDGRNAHLTVESGAWWQARCESAGFHVEPGPASPLKKPSREWVAVLTC